MIKKKVTTILQQQVNKHFLPDANLIVPDFTIVVFGTLSLASHPALGMPTKRKWKQRSDNETGKELIT